MGTLKLLACPVEEKIRLDGHDKSFIVTGQQKMKATRERSTFLRDPMRRKRSNKVTGATLFEKASKRKCILLNSKQKPKTAPPMRDGFFLLFI